LCGHYRLLLQPHTTQRTQIIPNFSDTVDWSDTAGQLSGSPAAFSHGNSTNSVTFNTADEGDKVTATDGPISTVSHALTIK
jgi:hypothetical protein